MEITILYICTNALRAACFPLHAKSLYMYVSRGSAFCSVRAEYHSYIPFSPDEAELHQTGPGHDCNDFKAIFKSGSTKRRASYMFGWIHILISKISSIAKLKRNTLHFAKYLKVNEVNCVLKPKGRFAQTIDQSPVA